jgi:hypothetical protein
MYFDHDVNKILNRPDGNKDLTAPERNRETDRPASRFTEPRLSCENIFRFFVEMHFSNGYKLCVVNLEILRFSLMPFQRSGNKVSGRGTVSYRI